MKFNQIQTGELATLLCGTQNDTRRFATTILSATQCSNVGTML